MDNDAIEAKIDLLTRMFSTFAQQAGYEFDEMGNATRVAKPAGVPAVVKKKSSGKFEKPDCDEVFLYMANEKGVIAQVAQAESQKFIDYFDSIGWVVGGSKKPMKSWKSAVSGWLTRKAEEIQKETKRYSFKQLAQGEHLTETAKSFNGVPAIESSDNRVISNQSAMSSFALLEQQHRMGN